MGLWEYAGIAENLVGEESLRGGIKIGPTRDEKVNL